MRGESGITCAAAIARFVPMKPPTIPMEEGLLVDRDGLDSVDLIPPAVGTRRAGFFLSPDEEEEEEGD